MMMMRNIILFVTCILGTVTMLANGARYVEEETIAAPSPSEDVSSSQPPSSSNSSDCSTIIYDMVDCIPYLSDDSTATKPDATCCTGFQTVVSINEECICEAIKSSSQMGILLNLTRAMALPSACGVSGVSLSDCGISLAPGSEPGSPVESPMPPAGTVPPSNETQAPAPASSEGGPTVSLVPGPAPAPSKGGTFCISTSYYSLSIGLLASFFFISV